MTKRSEAIKAIKELIEINLESLEEVPDAELVAALILDWQETNEILKPWEEEDEV